MRRLIPDTLVGRTLVVLVLGLVLAQLAGAALFSINRTEFGTRLSARQAAERVVSALRLVESTPVDDRVRVLQAIDAEGLRAGWGQMPLVRDDEPEGEAGAIADDLKNALPGRQVLVSGARPPHSPGEGEGPPPHPPMDREGPPPRDFPRELPPPGFGMRHGGMPFARVSVLLSDGGWLNFVVPLPNGEPLWRPGFFGPLGGGLLVVTALSVMAVRRAARPLADLAAAAERLGRDVGAPPLPEAGPREVRAAAQAFNRMQTRLRRFVDDRTQMVAAISHDLRTPITRLRLRAEFVEDDEQRAKMLIDLEEMEAMIAATLAFARDDAAREKRGPVDLAALLAELCADIGLTYDGPETLVVCAGALALKRAFANLLDNARKYAGDAVVTLSSGPGAGVTVTVDDHGPGLPAEELEKVFTPFYRVEASRNRETGGTGLGLSVARSVARAHGGDVRLFNRREGGLRAAVTLPG